MKLRTLFAAVCAVRAARPLPVRTIMKNRTDMRMRRIFCCLLAFAATAATGKNYTVTSPSGVLSVTVAAGDTTTYALSVRGVEVLRPSRIAMRLKGGETLGDRARVVKAASKRVSERIEAPFYRQRAFTAEYERLDLRMAGGYGIEFRAYDDGVAYRFYTMRRDSLLIADEIATFAFAEDYPLTIPYADRRQDIYESSFESQYTREPASAVRGHEDRLAFLPILADLGERGRLLLMESDVEAYPGMFVSFGDAEFGLRGVFPPRPAEIRLTYSGEKRPVRYGDAIARTAGARTFPWRVVGYAADDVQLPVNNMVYQLAAPNRIGDTEWVRPGRATWDWWNGVRLTGVDFRAGINTQTYKYHIDFAARYGIEYVLIDDGWYSYEDRNLLHPVSDVDVAELCRYGAERGVRILLWSVGNTLLAQAEEACSRYAALGVAGFKVDFFDAQDQMIVEDIYRLAEVTARHRLLIDFHGMYKPTGLNRTYPNVVNFEGVFGLEQLKWTDRDKADMPLNDVLIPFVRMASGPMDYTQGAMINAAKADFRAVDKRPMSQGTRAHQVAMYAVYDSPLVMLCDSPSHYLREEETTRFICSIPTVFDSTRVLAGRAGEYIVVARERGGVWYLGGLTSWQGRSVEVDLSFLGEGEWEARIFRDGVNSDLSGEDYRLETRTATRSTVWTVDMAPGGGFAAILSPRR